MLLLHPERQRSIGNRVVPRVHPEQNRCQLQSDLPTPVAFGNTIIIKSLSLFLTPEMITAVRLNTPRIVRPTPGRYDSATIIFDLKSYLTELLGDMAILLPDYDSLILHTKCIFHTK